MNDPRLSPTSRAILETLIGYHSERLVAFERAQSARARIPELYDGKYSLTRLLAAARDDQVHVLAPYELEVSKRIAGELGREPEPGYYYVPFDRERLVTQVARRDLTASVAGSGGYLVGTETAPGNIFVGALLATLSAVKLGMPIISMTGNATTPRVSGTVTAGWLSNEGAALTESDFTFAAAAGTPKTCGAYCEVSGQWLKQTSPFAQNFVLGELARATSAVVSKAIVQGTGAAGQPTGILSTAGIGSVSGTSLAYDDVLDIMHTVENQDAIANPAALAWAMPPTTAKLLRGRERAAGSGFLIEDNRMAGAPVDVTNAMPAGTALFGDWSSVALLEWGVLQVGADPYGVNSELFSKGLVGVRSLWTIDVVTLRPKSWCKSESIS
jgi:HK97 family phage major capsid protein